MKKFIGTLLCVIMILGNVPVHAATASPLVHTGEARMKIANCRACGHTVASYGVDQFYSTVSHYATAGEKCEGCGKIVQKGTQHWYYTVVKLYYYRCDDSCCRNKSLNSRIFTYPYYDTTPYGHEIQKTSN